MSGSFTRYSLVLTLCAGVLGCLPVYSYPREYSYRIREPGLSPDDSTRAFSRETRETRISLFRKELANLKIDMVVDRGTLPQIIKAMHAQTGVSFHIDVSVKDAVDLEKAIEFKVTRLSALNALNHIAKLFSVDYLVTGDRVVIITPRVKINYSPIIKVYPVGDITARLALQDQLVMKRAGHRNNHDTDALQGLIKKNVAPWAWDNEEYSLTLLPQGRLVVNGRPWLQLELQEFLRKLRSALP